MKNKVLIVETQTSIINFYSIYLFKDNSYYFFLRRDKSSYNNLESLIKETRKYKDDFDIIKMDFDLLNHLFNKGIKKILIEYNSIDELLNDNTEHLI